MFRNFFVTASGSLSLHKGICLEACPAPVSTAPGIFLISVVYIYQTRCIIVNMKANEVREVFSRRLRQARVIKGLSLRQLSQAVEGRISHNALAKYESALMMPDSGVLIALSKALEQPADFFFRPFTARVGDVRFRRKSRLPEKSAAAIRELSATALERYREIEELTGEIRQFEPIFKDGQIGNTETGEQLAERTRAEWNLGNDPIPNLHELLEEKGIKVVELREEDSSFDGLSATTDVGPVIVLASHLNRNVPRKRLTEAHELAHVLLPEVPDMTGKAEEAVAYRFAGAFLMPAESFTAAFGKHRTGISLGELMTLKARYGASMMAIMMRAKQLGLITEHTHRQFCKFASIHGWRSKGHGEPGDEAFLAMETDCRYKQLVLRAVAEDTISASKGAALLGLALDKFREEFKEVVTGAA